jgi:hypothetical protein
MCEKDVLLNKNRDRGKLVGIYFYSLTHITKYMIFF